MQLAREPRNPPGVGTLMYVGDVPVAPSTAKLAASGLLIYAALGPRKHTGMAAVAGLALLLFPA